MSLSVQVFATPKRHHKSKPFFDHVISFSVADGRIWLRNYQVLPDPDKKAAASADSVSLVEVRPGGGGGGGGGLGRGGGQVAGAASSPGHCCLSSRGVALFLNCC